MIMKKLISNIIKNPDKLKKIELTDVYKNINFFKQNNTTINSMPLDIKKVLVHELIDSVYWNGSTLNISFKN